jgi:hypothetical protein
VLEVSELLVVLNLDDDGRFDEILEGSGGWGGCNGRRVIADGFELIKGIKKRFVGRLAVLVVVVVFFRLVFLLETRRCSLAERGITTVEDDKPNLEKRGVSS